MSLKRNSGVAAALLMLLASSASAGEFDISMEVVGPDESFDQAIVSRIALPFGKNGPGSENVPTTHINDQPEASERVLQERILRRDRNAKGGDMPDFAELQSRGHAPVPGD